MLEAKAKPAVPLPLPVARGGGDGVGEHEETGGGATFSSEPVDEEGELVVEHVHEALARDIASGVTVDGVADTHVVSRHTLGHGARGPPGLEEMSNNLLAGTNFGEGTIEGAVKVDAQGPTFG